MKPVDEFKQFAPQAKKPARINNCFANNNTPAKNQPGAKPEIKSFSSLSEKRARHRWIAESAYFIAEHRDFAPGHALDDWLEAEQLYNQMLLKRFLELVKEDGEITVTGLKQLARAVGVKNTDKLYSKNDLICAIQCACKNTPCYKIQPAGNCLARLDCIWEAECQKLIARWQR